MREGKKRQGPAASEPSCVIEVQVVPRSSRVLIEAAGETQYRVKLTSPPLDGAANDQLVRILAQRLDLPRRRIEIISGEKARSKRVRLHGISPDIVQRLLMTS